MPWDINSSTSPSPIGYTYHHDLSEEYTTGSTPSSTQPLTYQHSIDAPDTHKVAPAGTSLGCLLRWVFYAELIAIIIIIIITPMSGDHRHHHYPAQPFDGSTCSRSIGYPLLHFIAHASIVFYKLVVL
ncbi:hypothetical protein [Absidia glauca]|uniref:Uncharacterized protein n=1 Tax=Absidia glauca TaxID=4829 RepID=A0A163TGG5_ABSGL|nr:hypothetical protein [Absidia glauca]